MMLGTLATTKHEVPVPIIPNPLDRMYQETVKALQSPEMKVVWESQGATAGGETPEKFAALINAEIAKWAKVVKDAGAKIDN